MRYNTPATLPAAQFGDFGAFILAAAGNEQFRQELESILKMPDTDVAAKDVRRTAFKTSLGKYGVPYTEDRYDAVMSLYLGRDMDTGEVFRMLRDFASAFGHPNIGVFN